MNDEMVQKIVSLFDFVGCPALFVLKTSRAGEEVENGMGVDFDLATYAVIHEGSLYDSDLGEDKYSAVYKFEHENNTDIMHFDKEGCTPNPEALCENLKEMDGYEIVWRKEV
jgi:hypothetical protein